jgi:hypothetical protein
MRNPADAPLALRIDSSELKRRLKRMSRTASIRAARALDSDSNHLFGLRDMQVVLSAEERRALREAQQREIMKTQYYVNGRGWLPIARPRE